MLRFIQTHSEGSDCTAPYDVILDRPYTVSEFINEILKRKSEWGKIYIRDTLFTCTYKYGEADIVIPEKLAKLSIKKVCAVGGWTRMDYYLYVSKY